MPDGNRGASYLDSRAAKIITDESVDFGRYLNPEEQARIIPAEALIERGKRNLLLGPDVEEGLFLPWEKTHSKVKIRRGKLALWVGWSHHGKSQILKQLMLHAIATGERVCIASMEEEVLTVWEDMGKMACGSDRPSKKDVDRWCEFSTKGLWLYDQQGDVKAEKILAVMNYCARELGVTQFVVDSLMMLAVPRDDYEAQSTFVGRLKTMAKDTGCTAHLVAHMRKNDSKTGEDRPGSVHDISGGHEISSKADYVFNVWRNKNDIPELPKALLKVDKQRGRMNWLGKIGLDFHNDSRQYVDGKSPIRFWNEEPPL